MTWKGESRRHELASRGIATKITQPPKYSRKSIDNMTRKELAIEVKKVFDDVLYEFVTNTEQDMAHTENALTDYDEYINYRNKHGELSEGYIIIPGFGKEPRMGALELFDVKPDWDEKKIKAEFKKRQTTTPKKKTKDEFKSITQDLQIFTDKKLKSKHSDVGWTVEMIDKPKDSNVLLMITYDGGAYDYFSPEADYGGGMITKALDKKLKERFGKNVLREDYTSWASEIYDTR